MGRKYSFITKWEVTGTMEQAWEAIYNSLEWPQWWRGVTVVTEIQKNDERGINGIREYTWKSILPYRLTFKMRLTENEYMKRLKGLAFGELEGAGEWFFSEREGVVLIQYNWNVITTKNWMNTFSFFLRPLFNFNHNVVMHWGAKGLCKKLGSSLLKG